MSISKASFATGNGVSIRLSEATFEFASTVKQGRTQRSEITACTDAPADLVTSSLVLGGAPTSVCLLIDGDTVTAQVLVKGLESIAGLVFDLGNPAILPWLNSARRSGYFPIALAGPRRTRIVHVHLSQSVSTLIERARDLRQLTPEETADAVSRLIGELGDADAVRELGFSAGRLKEATIGVCLSMNAMAGLNDAAVIKDAVR